MLLLKAAAKRGMMALTTWLLPVAKGPVEQERMSAVLGLRKGRVVAALPAGEEVAAETKWKLLSDVRAETTP